MAKKRTIHVVGTGTLGEPLVNLLLDMKEDVAVDEITFHKNTPRVSDRTRIQRGAFGDSYGPTETFLY